MQFTVTDTVCVHHADFNLNKITVLMGENGCGKTTCTALLGNLLSAACALHAPTTWKPKMKCTLTDSMGNVIVSEDGIKPCTEIVSVIGPPTLAGKLPPTPVRWTSIIKRIETLIGGKFVCEPGITNAQLPCSIQRYDGAFIKPLFFSRFDNILYLLSHYLKHDIFVKDALWMFDTPDLGLSPSNIVELADLIIQVQHISQMKMFLTCCTVDFARALRTINDADVNVYIAQQFEDTKTYDYTLLQKNKQFADYARQSNVLLQSKLK